ncbi:MAG TPA: polysaccharide deacetylase family protein [Polyangiaceae bacterium]|nr:polysaccharide deacetylase family protein [Polyangiaceae bacterium]
MSRLCAISVDLDAISSYRAIHGLDPGQTTPDPVLRLGVSRLSQWAQDEGLPLTWFVVGRDLDDSLFADSMFGLCRRGHELGNHSLDHFYDLTRRDQATIRDQIWLSSERLSRLTGRSAHGFRAPGYTLSEELLDVLKELRVPYDSSLFPCPIYYAAKAVALFGQRLFGRNSAAILGKPQVLTACTRPYRMGSAYQEDEHGLIEIPIQVTRGLRLPLIGTSMVLLGARGARALVQQVVGERLLNLELHGIDALDASDGLGELAAVQRDLRIPWRSKLGIFSGVVRQLKQAGYLFVTLQDLAFAVSPAAE